MLFEGLRTRGIPTELVWPKPFFGRLKASGNGIGKWLGYLDKFLVFPFTLHRKTRQCDADETVLVHVCDHSNAPYLAQAASVPSVVTCHDLGAVRGARGEATYCLVSRTGRILQKWILKSLARAGRIVCDSTATMTDVQRLLGSKGPQSQVVLLGLNQQFGVRSKVETESMLTRALPQGYLGDSYLLHVGSSLARKNRDGILRIFHRIKDRWRGKVVFAGEPLPADLRRIAIDLGITDRVIVVERPNSDLLTALYNRAFALLFPSHFEGFGWPVIEAQACGCPVICSNATSLPEVAGSGALMRNADDEQGFADDVLSLCEPETREALIRRGFENVRRFSTERMVDEYLSIYRELVAAS
jgi:glycosyltransferase involved in cell wall biosynthesis